MSGMVDLGSATGGSALGGSCSLDVAVGGRLYSALAGLRCGKLAHTEACLEAALDIVRELRKREAPSEEEDLAAASQSDGVTATAVDASGPSAQDFVDLALEPLLYTGEGSWESSAAEASGGGGRGYDATLFDDEDAFFSVAGLRARRRNTESTFMVGGDGTFMVGVRMPMAPSWSECPRLHAADGTAKLAS